MSVFLDRVYDLILASQTPSLGEPSSYERKSTNLELRVECAHPTGERERYADLRAHAVVWGWGSGNMAITVTLPVRLPATVGGAKGMAARMQRALAQVLHGINDLPWGEAQELLDWPHPFAQVPQDAPAEAPPAPSVLPPAPVPLLLHCPECGARHVDKGFFATAPHHTHACQECGMTWRPAVVPTVGVQHLPGFKD